MANAAETTAFRIEGAVVRETGKAILCRILGEDRWVPKSVVQAGSEVTGYGDEGMLIVAQWWAYRNGLG